MEYLCNKPAHLQPFDSRQTGQKIQTEERTASSTNAAGKETGYPHVEE